MNRRSGVAVGILLLAWLAIYAPILLAGKMLPARDVAATQVPWRAVWADQVRARVPPLWDPYSNGGRPLLANPNAMAAYPGTALFLLASPETAAAWHLALHHLLLLLGCYRLARRGGAPEGPAAVGAAAAATSGLAWSALTFLNFQASLTWAVWAAGSALPAPTDRAAAVRRGLAGGALLGLAFLGGEPVTAAIGALVWAVLAAARWRRLAVLGLPAAALAAAGIAAPVLLPLLATYPDTARAHLGLAPGALSADALAPRRYLELLCPTLLGPPLADARGGFWAAPSFPWQRYDPLIFLGASALVALPFARGGGRGLRAWWAIAGGGIAAALLLGLAPVSAAAEQVGLLGAARYTIKLMVLPVIALAPLVAAGWERLQQRWREAGRRWVLGLCAALVLALPLALAANRLLRPLLAAAYPASAATLAGVPAATLRRDALRDWLALALLPGAAAVAGPGAEIATATVLAGNWLGGRDVLLADGADVWRTPPALVAVLPPHATVASFAAEGTPAAWPDAAGLRPFWAARAALVPEYGTRWGIAYVLSRGPDGLEPYRAELLAAEAAHLALAERAALAQSLGAQAVIAGKPVGGWPAQHVDGVWSSLAPHPAPRAYLARRELPAEGPVAAARLLAAPGFRPGEDAVVDGGGGAQELAGGALTEVPSPPHHRRFETSAEGPGLLVVQQSYLHCWRAAVDGRPARVEPVNGAALGVRVPAGRHAVELFLDPTPYRLGALGPLAVLLAAALTWRAGASRGRAAPTRGAARTTPASPPAPPR